MNGTDGGLGKLTVDRIVFGITFVVISSMLCLFVHVPVLLYFALIFLSGLIAYFVSNFALRWLDRLLEVLEERRKQSWHGPRNH